MTTKFDLEPRETQYVRDQIETGASEEEVARSLLDHMDETLYQTALYHVHRLAGLARSVRREPDAAN